jgi:nitrite reductase/ring-hydroxylating ferredoxin subunit
MPDFIEAAQLDQMAPGTRRVVTVAGKDVALFNVDGNIHAMADTCPHAGASLAAGKIDGKIVTCRAHGLKFDVTTGQSPSVPGFGVASHAVKIRDGKISIAIA